MDSFATSGTDARLESFFSCLSMTEYLFVPTGVDAKGPMSGTAPKNDTTSAKDTSKETRRAMDGLYCAWFDTASGSWKLRVPGTDPAGGWAESPATSLENLRRMIDNFRKEWPLVEVKAQNATYVAHQGTDDDGQVLQCPLNEKTLEALKNGTPVRLVDVKFWKEKLKNMRTDRESNIMNDIWKGTILYTPETRGDFVRLYNAKNLASPTSDSTRLMECVELMRLCPEDVRKSLFTSFSGKHIPYITDKHIILYNFCTKGIRVSEAEVSPKAPKRLTNNGLKPEQMKAAKDFADRSTVCSLLYWSPGVGKTLGAWAAIVEAAKAGDYADVGVTFLSSGPNLPREKFIAELKDNVEKLGVSFVDQKKKTGEVTTIELNNTSKYPVGWYWTFSLNLDNSSDKPRSATFHVVACTYFGFSRGAATVLFEGKSTGFVEGAKELFSMPKQCDLILNVCDEAHVLRDTSVGDLENAKTQRATIGQEITEEAVKNLNIDEKKLMRYHAWAWPPKNTRWTKIPWEGLRTVNNAYFPSFENTKRSVHKTLILTATPFGNIPSHLENLLTCGLYSANAEIIKTSTKEVSESHDEEGENDLKMFVGAGGGKSFSVELIESLLYPVDSTPRMRVSVATIDPNTAPRQDFGCCHFFSGEGGTVIAPGGTKSRKGGLPWSQEGLLDAVVLGIRTNSEGVEEGDKLLYERTTKTRSGIGNVVETVSNVVKREKQKPDHEYCLYTVVFQDGSKISLREGLDKLNSDRYSSVEKIIRVSPGTLIRKIDRLYTRRRDTDGEGEEPDADDGEPDAAGEEPDAEDGEPDAEGEEPDAEDGEPDAEGEEPDGEVDKRNIRDDEKKVAEGEVAKEEQTEAKYNFVPFDEDIGDSTNQQSRYEDVGVFYWHNVDKPQGLILSTDINFKDDGEEADYPLMDADDPSMKVDKQDKKITRNLQLMKLRELYVRGGTRSSGRNTFQQASDIDLNGKDWYEKYMSGKTTGAGNHIREHLRAYSPRYELLFHALESGDVKERTPVVVFFGRVSGFSLESLGGFRWYADMRNRHRHEDFEVEERRQHKYWFVKFTSKDKTTPFVYDEKRMKSEVDAAKEKYNTDKDAPLEDIGTVAACLMFYKEVFEEENMNDASNDADEASLKSSVLTRVREIMWDKCVDKTGIESDDTMMRYAFINEPDKHHVVCAVTGEDTNARDWASYLLDENTGAYNHPVNRFGEIVRVMAGADKIGESNDFRSTRHMFFTNPDTDVVKLLQKFGRICRSSDPERYPHYEYGFHRDHLFDDDGVKKVPVVHYVTLARPAEMGAVFENINRKAKFYNEYARLLARGEGDAGLVVRDPKILRDWKKEIKSLVEKRDFFNFTDGGSYAEISNLYGSAEWEWAKRIMDNGLVSLSPPASVVKQGIDGLHSASTKWSWSDLLENVNKFFPSNLVQKENTDKLLKLREYLLRNQSSSTTPVPTGIFPRLFLKLVIGKKATVGGLLEHVCRLLKVNATEQALRDWLTSCVSWSTGRDQKTIRLDALEQVMRNKFSSPPYDKMQFDKIPDMERGTRLPGTSPYGYDFSDLNIIVEKIFLEKKEQLKTKTL
jgi:hypothetical protein